MAPDRPATAVAQGRKVLDRRVRQGVVLYIAAEDGPGMRLRVRALKQEHGDAPDFNLIDVAVDLMRPTENERLQELIEHIRRLQPVFIIIDTLAASFPGLKENQGDMEGMGRVIQLANELSSYVTGEAIVMVLSHPPVSDDGRSRGHGSLEGDGDVTMRIEGTRNEPRVVKLKKNRNGPSDISFTFELQTVVLGKDEDGDDVTAVMARETVSKVAAKDPNAGLGKVARNCPAC